MNFVLAQECEKCDLAVIEVDLNLFYQIFSNAFGPKDMIYAETRAIELAAKKVELNLKNNN